ncbi:hypothetical protein GALMADRAFT_778543 [Galerina marginata CBS 339.88]|uniref:Uncharacterized protein n=1 Tax=Galerina marginata (strain CBS 339.88) TaxID=685588 RepID=A0A067SNY6_GALM3|nr:hypothetical protein GALMADRAFT_778543 [Galerina marginata CBS 339.88]
MPPSSSSAATTATVYESVFWPKGSTKSGICYGWSKPAICVAGVLDGLLVGIPSAGSVHEWISRWPSWQAVKDSCGGHPVLLGTCTFDEESRSPVPSFLELWDFGEREVTFSFVLYHRHSPHSLRFYVMDMPQSFSASKTSSQRNPYQELANYDFTRPQNGSVDKGLSDMVINQ